MNRKKKIWKYEIHVSTQFTVFLTSQESFLTNVRAVITSRRSSNHHPHSPARLELQLFSVLCSLRVAPLLSSADARSKLALLSFLCSSLALARQTYVSASEYAPCPISLHDLLEPRVYRQRLGLQPKGRREQTREQSKCRRRRRFEDDLSWHG